MSQQINLFEGVQVRRRQWFNLSMVLAVYALAAAAMLVQSGRMQDEVQQLQTQQAQAQASYDAIQSKLDTLAQQIKPVDQSQLTQQLQQLRARLDMQTQVLQIFQASLSETAPQLVDYMRALAAQPYPGVWLTGFNITPAAAHLTLLGQALQTQDIPAYLGQLSTEKLFAGTQFSGIQFKQLQLQLPNTAATPASSATPNATPIITPVNAPATAADTRKGSADNATASPSPAASSSPASVTSAAPAAGNSPARNPVTPPLVVYAFEVKGQDAQAAARQASGLSWDAFVEQTIQAAPAK